MNFGKIAMKLRYGQVAMKILRYGPIGEIRAESPATGPLKILHKKISPIRGDFSLVENYWICLANNHRNHGRGSVAQETVISDKTTNSHILPQSPVYILVSQGIILGKFDMPIIDKGTIFRHGVIWRPLIISRMLCGSAFKVICRTNLENIAPLFVDIMSDIQELFSPCLQTNYNLPLFWQGRGRPTLPRYFFGLRFCTSVSSKLSPPIENAICLSLLVIDKSAIEN